MAVGKSVSSKAVFCIDAPVQPQFKRISFFMALFTTLYSGSSGNCALILHEGKYLLIDMGKSCRTTLNALRSLGLAVSDCEGILITHEHSDLSLIHI